jgi:hypothetical protein
MTVPSIIVVTGQPVSIPIQCNTRGSGDVPAVYNASDTLTAEVVQARQTTPLFAPSVAWYTASNTQNGYLQGQVEATWLTANATLLVPTISYTLLVWRTLASYPNDPELIARQPLVVEPLALP